jgi:hypothetical protein
VSEQNEFSALLQNAFVRALAQSKDKPFEGFQRFVVIIKTINATLDLLAGKLKAEVANQDHLVILVHGICTRALWMNELKPALQDAGFDVQSTSYGVYGVPRFLLPFDRPRQKAIARVVKDIHSAIGDFENKRGRRPTRMSVISHSFGTYVISRILDENRELKWFRIIFCGSVVREDYPLEKVKGQFTTPLLNEVGTNDFWPALGESAGWGYGSIGSYAWNRPGVETRWHHGFGHSDLLKRSICESHWIPFLRGEKPLPGSPYTELPLWIRGIAQLPLRVFLLPIIPFLVYWKWFLVAICPVIIWVLAQWFFGGWSS